MLWKDILRYSEASVKMLSGKFKDKYDCCILTASLPTCSLTEDRSKVIPEIFWVLSWAKVFCQSGLDLAAKAAFERWHVAGYTSQVYSLESCNRLVNASGELRILSVMKRDLLLGFDKFYIKGAIKVNPESVPSLFIRCQLLRCAFSFQVVAWLLDKVISSVNVGGSSTCVGRLFETGVSSRAWGLQLKFYAEKSDFTKEELELVHQYLAIAEKNGSDVRLDLGLPFCPKAWPRVGLSPKAWHWRISQNLCFEPGCLQDMDEAWAHFEEASWSESESLTLALQARAGLQGLLPNAKGHLRHSWRLANACSKAEPSVRARPFASTMHMGLFGLAFFLQRVDIAALFAIGLDGFLQSGELFSVRVMNVIFAREGASLQLSVTRGGLRRGLLECMVIKSSFTFALLEKELVTAGLCRS
jgi:hypothetical protein